VAHCARVYKIFFSVTLHKLGGRNKYDKGAMPSHIMGRAHPKKSPSVNKAAADAGNAISGNVVAGIALSATI